MRRALPLIALATLSCAPRAPDPRWPGWQGRMCRIHVDITGSHEESGTMLVAIDGDRSRVLEVTTRHHWHEGFPPATSSGWDASRTTHRYDAAGRRVELVSATQHREERITVSYDDAGRVISRTLTSQAMEGIPRELQARRERCTISYDDAGRMTRVERETRKQGAPDERHVTLHRHVAEGQPADAPPEATTYVERHDERGRWVATEAQLGGRHAYTDRYERDDAGRLHVLRREDPKGPGFHERYDRDVAGRLLRVVRPSGEGIEHTYDAQGRPLATVRRVRRLEQPAARAHLRLDDEGEPDAPAFDVTTTSYRYDCETLPGAAQLLVDHRLVPGTSYTGCTLTPRYTPVEP